MGASGKACGARAGVSQRSRRLLLSVARRGIILEIRDYVRERSEFKQSARIVSSAISKGRNASGI